MPVCVCVCASVHMHTCECKCICVKTCRCVCVGACVCSNVHQWKLWAWGLLHICLMSSSVCAYCAMMHTAAHTLAHPLTHILRNDVYVSLCILRNDVYSSTHTCTPTHPHTYCMMHSSARLVPVEVRCTARNSFHDSLQYHSFTSTRTLSHACTRTRTHTHTHAPA